MGSVLLPDEHVAAVAYSATLQVGGGQGVPVSARTGMLAQHGRRGSYSPHLGPVVGVPAGEHVATGNAVANGVPVGTVHAESLNCWSIPALLFEHAMRMKFAMAGPVRVLGTQPSSSADEL